MQTDLQNPITRKAIGRGSWGGLWVVMHAVLANHTTLRAVEARVVLDR
jgi:hypothetical protein